MARRFTVIQGGLSETTALPAPSDRPRPPLVLAWNRDAQSVPAASRLADGEAAAAIDRAIRTRLAVLGRPVRPAGASRAPSRAADRPRQPRAIPAHNVLGVRPEGWAPPAVAVPVFEDRVRAVAAPSAPAQGGITRGLSARRGALRLALLRRIDAIVAGMVNLGAGPAVWRRVRG